MAGTDAGAKPATPRPAVHKPVPPPSAPARPAPTVSPVTPTIMRPPASYAQVRPIVAAARPQRHGIHFSGIEFLHLLVGAAVLTYAFAVVTDSDLDRPFQENLVPGQWTLLAAFIAVTTGFVLHELAHKVVAQRYGHWAEFRAGVAGLLMALALSPFGFLVALPGATWIQGDVTRKESGIISLYGPLVNFVIAWVAFPFSIAVNPGEPVPFIAGLVAQVNAFLAAFNLLPIPFFGVALDGVKVWRWNRPTWVASFLLALASAGFITAWSLHVIP